uniref:Uncharacterized protein n=1 Tax=Populus trichocarpa TaxID=3694 RepID=A9PEJ1_POPTR|nr:unknown [Populus trichocarpa]
MVAIVCVHMNLKVYLCNFFCLLMNIYVFIVFGCNFYRLLA